ncbi:Coiled-coil domain-containing protein [Rutstroemia sp. NJR-2017a WRK4]|nr:Coiled-coil domain-containing protein [Rutstroemia sp. NJR-2017a WRK4]
MSHDPHNLYNFKKPKLHDPNAKELSSSTNLAFSSTLSSLLASSTSSSTTRGRPRPSKTKEDIFKSHNKGAKKRAAKDLEDDEANDNGYTRIKNISSTVDESALHRSKRRLEAKAKIYNRLKHGEHDAEDNDEALVDFDRKWAENGGRDDSESDTDDTAAEMVEYEDEFGRLRKGTPAEAARMARKKAARLRGAEELVQMSARPSMPNNLIHGDTIQSSAFTTSLTDDKISKMEELAQKRDRSATPPEMRHYEADAEVRRRGTGFYAFSKDEKVREEEMRGLEELRRGTEEVRRGREEGKERRRREVEERRRVLGEKRARRQAERFLEGLDVEGGLGGEGEEIEDERAEGKGK